MSCPSASVASAVGSYSTFLDKFQQLTRSTETDSHAVDELIVRVENLEATNAILRKEANLFHYIIEHADYVDDHSICIMDTGWIKMTADQMTIWKGIQAWSITCK